MIGAAPQTLQALQFSDLGTFNILSMVFIIGNQAFGLAQINMV
jgi:hypothetical protein